MIIHAHQGRYPKNEQMHETHPSYSTTNKFCDYLYFKMYGTLITLLLSRSVGYNN